MDSPQLHHHHKFEQKSEWAHPDAPPMLVLLACFSEDCYTGPAPLNRETYPPELIGPKLEVAK